MEEIIREIPMDNSVLSDEEAKDLRKDEWRNNIEVELQPLIIQAVSFQKNIKEAKTKTKKDHYQKKFDKIKGKVRQYVVLLNALGTDSVTETHDNLLTFANQQEQLQKQGTENVIIPTT